MTQPQDVPTAKPPGDLTPATPLAPLTVVSRPPALPMPEKDLLADTIAPAIGAAIQEVGADAYFSMLRRTDPNLFYKWAALALRKDPTHDQRNQTVVNVVHAIGPSPLDELPKGFEIR